MGMNFKVGLFETTWVFYVVVATVLAIAPITISIAKRRNWILCFMANPLLTGSDVSVGASRLSLARRSIGIQAAYYTLTGIWPIVHRRSFEAVTGRKTDYWLVQMVGSSRHRHRRVAGASRPPCCA